MTAIEKIQSTWNKPDNPFWKKVGNFCTIIASPAGTLAILIFVPEPFKQASIAVWVSIMAAIKATTKLTVK
jgi:hypothetical protein